SFDQAQLAQSLPKAVDERCGRRADAQEADALELARLLRADGSWSCGDSARQRDDELPAVHSITSSARCWKNKGTSMRSALAVFRLITSSNFIGCSTGMSEGLLP